MKKKLPSTQEVQEFAKNLTSTKKFHNSSEKHHLEHYPGATKKNKGVF